MKIRETLSEHLSEHLNGMKIVIFVVGILHLSLKIRAIW